MVGGLWLLEPSAPDPPCSTVEGGCLEEPCAVVVEPVDPSAARSAAHLRATLRSGASSSSIHK